MQNLLDRMKDIFKDEIPSAIFIRDGAVLDKAPEKKISLVCQDVPCALTLCRH